MPPTWQITLQYVALFIVCFAVMKLVNFGCSTKPRRDRWNYLWVSIFLSMRAWECRRPVKRADLVHLLIKSAVVLPAVAAVYSVFPLFLAENEFSSWTRGYLAVVPFWIVAEGIGLVVQLVVLPVWMLPPFLDGVYRSRSLSEFWGRRWNSWHGGWFWEVAFRWCRRRPWIGTCGAFLISGLWHEVLVAVPLWSVFGERVYGQMTAYFLIQAAGLIVGHRWLRRRPAAQRLWTWAIVILPAPLVLNHGTLLIFHLTWP